MADAIYILDARPSKNKKFIAYVCHEMRDYLERRKTSFVGDQFRIDHLCELHYSEKDLDGNPVKGCKPHIVSLKQANEVSFSDREISAFLKAKLPEEERNRRLKEIYGRGKHPYVHRHKGEVVEYGNNFLFSRSGCKEMLARELGLYETEKEPTWEIKFLARRPKRQLESFVWFLKTFDINDGVPLSYASKLYVETAIGGVYKAVKLE
jgi:hypothetical protein